MREQFSREESQIRELSRLILASEDIDFAINAVSRFIETSEEHEKRDDCRDLKQHLFHSAIISYSKMFIISRGGSGILKIRSIPSLSVKFNKDIHLRIIELRNICIAHNDINYNRTFIGWSRKHNIHFPQRHRKTYWSEHESHQVLTVMKSVYGDIIEKIYDIFLVLNIAAGKKYQIQDGCITRGD